MKKTFEVKMEPADAGCADFLIEKTETDLCDQGWVSYKDIRSERTKGGFRLTADIPEILVGQVRNTVSEALSNCIGFLKKEPSVKEISRC